MGIFSPPKKEAEKPSKREQAGKAYRHVTGQTGDCGVCERPIVPGYVHQRCIEKENRKKQMREDPGKPAMTKREMDDVEKEMRRIERAEKKAAKKGEALDKKTAKDKEQLHKRIEKAKRKGKV